MLPSKIVWIREANAHSKAHTNTRLASKSPCAIFATQRSNPLSEAQGRGVGLAKVSEHRADKAREHSRRKDGHRREAWKNQVRLMPPPG